MIYTFCDVHGNFVAPRRDYIGLHAEVFLPPLWVNNVTFPSRQQCPYILIQDGFVCSTLPQISQLTVRVRHCACQRILHGEERKYGANSDNLGTNTLASMDGEDFFSTYTLVANFRAIYYFSLLVSSARFCASGKKVTQWRDLQCPKGNRLSAI